MPFETKCQGCNRPLRVADEQAGKKARCPHCGMIFDVPPATGPILDVPLELGQQTPFAPTDLAPLGGSANGGGSADGSNELWQLRTEDGNVYGPVSRAELDRWAVEGRVTPKSHVSRAGLAQWTASTSLYPWLLQRAAQVNPFAERPSGPAVNPYATPHSAGFGQMRHLRPHRGGTILTLGILGILICNIMAPFAWAMGRSDLKEMKEGRMDPAGHGQTQAGMILGIVGTVLMIIICVLYFIGIAVSVANA